MKKTRRKIVIYIVATQKKDGRYLTKTSYCFDNDCSPKYKPNREEVKDLIMIFLEIAHKIKSVFYDKISRKRRN